ncbi:DUF397 domain-containing protein [Streptomyces malaysiense]|uniref:DUF397 domain-containing protein n=1 Tax=Streptomyces malaysiense TaxID=1428626 RepID=A0A1J4PX62_9ACTN|nr:DUF397 domain-containing protein [Streptomyces malaysiense]OIK24876.1 hypothetical protein VT52_025120 [Streptomyces malaysiense]
MSTGNPAWFESGHSSGEEAACVELSCIWPKSSHGGAEGGERAGAAGPPVAVRVRDSKLPAAHLTVHPSAWAAFLTIARVQARVSE